MVHGRDFDGFEWDANKSKHCFEERGIDFEYAVRIFEADYIEWEDERRDYGEPRFVSVGEVEEHVLAVVWAPRESIRRIISARPASRRERTQFYEARDTKHQGDT